MNRPPALPVLSPARFQIVMRDLIVAGKGVFPFRNQAFVYIPICERALIE